MKFISYLILTILSAIIWLWNRLNGFDDLSFTNTDIKHTFTGIARLLARYIYLAIGHFLVD